MADRGAQAAVLDAAQEIVEDFEHFPESEEGDFGALFTAIYYGPW